MFIGQKPQLYFRCCNGKAIIFRVTKNVRDGHTKLVRIAQMNTATADGLIKNQNNPPTEQELKQITLYAERSKAATEDHEIEAEIQLLNEFGRFIQKAERMIPHKLSPECALQLSFAFLDLRQHLLQKIGRL